ncbi:hypothetical protein [Agromyces mariniharenae]|uniref:Uncharacterized protein n=1 Tax=Agromyces mariniharenae TaxID=2604423 RepID=A0A5S4UZR0_9MICO|nr:hypothetical protein [Agromyces mariniharenae]TYL52357.1 hypothetical protein FYC51_00855 [Agromyces mariniharenae]
MADFARYLPLSQRPRVDERGVTSDRREPTATVLRTIATALRSAGDDAWTAHADDDATTVAEAVAELVAGFDRAPARRALESAQHALGMGGRAPASDVRVEGPADAAAALEARAVAIAERPQPTRLVELDDAVVAAVRIGDALRSPIAVPALASGAVALRRAAAAPTPIKAVISGHSLHATDAAWTIGHGPVLVGTAHELIRFLAGIGTRAPRPARQGELGDGADA